MYKFILKIYPSPRLNSTHFRTFRPCCILDFSYQKKLILGIVGNRRGEKEEGSRSKGNKKGRPFIFFFLLSHPPLFFSAPREPCACRIKK